MIKEQKSPKPNYKFDKLRDKAQGVINGRGRKIRKSHGAGDVFDLIFFNK